MRHMDIASDSCLLPFLTDKLPPAPASSFPRPDTPNRRRSPAALGSA